MKPLMNETRQQMFNRVLPEIFDKLKSEVFMVGRRAQIGSWGGDGIKKRVKALARAKARDYVRSVRRLAGSK